MEAPRFQRICISDIPTTVRDGDQLTSICYQHTIHQKPGTRPTSARPSYNQLLPWIGSRIGGTSRVPGRQLRGLRLYALRSIQLGQGLKTKGHQRGNAASRLDACIITGHRLHRALSPGALSGRSLIDAMRRKVNWSHVMPLSTSKMPMR